jgi:hypothetical protein
MVRRLPRKFNRMDSALASPLYRQLPMVNANDIGSAPMPKLARAFAT